MSFHFDFLVPSFRDGFFDFCVLLQHIRCCGFFCVRYNRCVGEFVNSYTVYLIMSFCSSLFFMVCFTVNLIYQATVVNLDPLQMVLVGTVLEITTFVLEVPTGVVA